MARIWLSPPHVGKRERELLLDAFDSNWIAPLGPHVDGFEREFAEAVGAGHAAALSSGTAALHLALLLLGVGPGDLVMVSTFTFAATVNAIRYVGAEPVLVDSDETWTMDPALLALALQEAKARGDRLGAVIVVDLYGQCADYDAINEVCAVHSVPVIEDAAEALGSTYRARSAGTLGAMGVFSFNGNKIITTSGGGMLVSESAEHIERARFLATQARDPAPHYQHSVIGFNYRMSNLLAAVGRGQLEILAQRVARRRAIRERYVAELGSLAGVDFMPLATYGKSNCWLTTMTIDPEAAGTDRDTIRLALAEHDIESRPVWKPMHLQPVFAAYRAYLTGVSNDLFARGLCLPSGSSLTEDDQGRVINAFRMTAV